MTTRALVGPLIVGAAIWCAAGVLTVAAPESAATRLAIPAAWWILPLAVAGATLVPAWRHRPLTALPAILSTLPWWPVPWPSVVLIWTGPLAWLPIGSALVAAFGSRPLGAIGRAVGAVDYRRSMTLAGAATLLAGILVAWSADAHVPSGDEPHYLVITQSLLHDHDLRIENNHRQRDYAAYFGGDIAPDFLRRGRDGEIYSIHAPGLPVLVLPVFALLGYRGVEAFLLLLAAVTGSLVWRIAWRATDDEHAAWFAWAAIVGSATFLLHSFTVYPDGPGALVVAVATLLLLRLTLTPEAVGTRALVSFSVLLAALPWLHTRFAVLAAGFGLATVWRILRDASRSPGSSRQRAVAFLILPCASAAAWLGFFQWIYGTPNPAAPYGSDTASRATYVPGGLTGLLFDEQFGLIAYAPVLAFAVVGLFRTKRAGVRAVAQMTTTIAALYLGAVSTYWLWWAGSPASPARFAVAVLPVCAVPLALAWSAATEERRRMMLAVLGISLAISAVVTTNHGELGWNMRNAEALWLDWLNPVVNLPRGWPSFFWKLDPAILQSEWPFVIHVAVWFGTFLVVWSVLWRLGRGRQWSAFVWRFALSCWICGGAMAATQAGWWLTGANALDPTRSQMSVLSAGEPVVEIASLAVHRMPTPNGRLSIVSEEPGRPDAPPPWLMLESVPAGAYELDVSTSRPRAGELLVYIGRAPVPIQRLQLKPLNRQTSSLVLPAGALGLVISPGPGLEKVTGRITLKPVLVTTSDPLARTARPYGSTNVYFLDDNVFTENDGFWVRGGRAASLVLESRLSPRPSFVLALQNGRTDNPVVLANGSVERREPLSASETKMIELASDSAGRLRLTISSPSGFRPSDDGVSQDKSYLGVWVRPK